MKSAEEQTALYADTQQRPVDLAVIVVAFDNDNEELDTLVDALQAGESEGNRDVLVVQNDNYRKYTSSKARTVQGHGNIGFGNAVNLGVSITDSNWILIVNPDCTVAPDVICGLIERAKSRPGNAIVTPLLVDSNGKCDESAYGDWTFTPGRIVARLRTRRFLRGSSSEQLPRGLKAPGTVLVMKREVAVALGPFEPAYFLYGEDRDMCRRAREQGIQILLDRRASVQHQGGVSGQRVPKLVLEAQADAAIRIAYRRYRICGAILASIDLIITALFRRRVEVGNVLWARGSAIRRWASSLLLAGHEPSRMTVIP